VRGGAARASGSGRRGADAARQQSQGRYSSGVAGAERTSARGAVLTGARWLRRQASAGAGTRAQGTRARRGPMRSWQRWSEARGRLVSADAGSGRGSRPAKNGQQATRACPRWRAEAGGVCRCWAAGAERAHRHEEAVPECDVPSNGTRRKSCGGKVLRKMRERDGRIEDAAQVFDEMPIRVVLENARVLLLDKASRVPNAVRRMLQRRAGQRHAGRWHAVQRLRADSHGSSETPREGCRKPLKRK
jgi:hypothetical protein